MEKVTAGRIFNHLFILYEDKIPEILHETNESYQAAEERLTLLVDEMQEKHPDISINMFDKIMGEIRTLRDLDNQLSYAIGVQDGIKISNLKPEEIAINLHDDLQH